GFEFFVGGPHGHESSRPGARRFIELSQVSRGHEGKPVGTDVTGRGRDPVDEVQCNPRAPLGLHPPLGTTSRRCTDLPTYCRRSSSCLAAKYSKKARGHPSLADSNSCRASSRASLSC